MTRHMTCTALGFRMTFSIVYYMTKLFGLAPFKYDPKKKRFVQTSQSTLINSTISIIVISMTFSSQTIAALFWISERQKLVALLAGVFECFLTIFQEILFLSIHFYHRKHLVTFLNRGIQIHAYLCKLSTNNDWLEEDFFSFMKRKSLIKLMQITLLTFSAIGYACKSLSAYRELFIIATVHLHMLTVMVTSVFYCGSVLASAHFLKILNVKLANLCEVLNKSQNEVDRQITATLMRKISFDISCVCLIFDKITQFVSDINKLFSFQVIFKLLSSLTYVLSTTFLTYCNFVENYGETTASRVELLTTIGNYSGFLVFHVIELYHICWCPYYSMQMAKETTILLHKIAQLTQNSHVIRKVEVKSMQILLNDQAFNGCKMFEINKSTIFQCTTTVLSFFIILVQFELADNQYLSINGY